MVNRFNGLGHHAVIGGYDQNNDVGCLGTPGTHGSKRLVTWGIQEGDHAAFRFNVVSTNVLRNAASFTRGHFCTANVVKQ